MTTKSKKPTTKKQSKTVEVLNSFFDEGTRAVYRPGDLCPLDVAKRYPKTWFKF